MDNENTIIPLCLFSTNKNSYIGLPEKIYQNEITYKCPDLPNFITTFYAINPDMRPIPTYADLFCLKTANMEIIDISVIYDPFNIDTSCTKFIAWLEPTPNTNPLYIFKNGQDIFISLKNIAPENYIPHEIPIIHVLFHPKLSGFPFQIGTDNMPKFTFSNSFGKCIPDPKSSMTIGQCVVLHNKNITNPENINKFPNILSYLETKYGSSKPVKMKKIILILFTIILILSILSLLWIKMKK